MKPKLLLGLALVVMAYLKKRQLSFFNH